MTNYKSWRIPDIGEKPRVVIIDENGNIVNRKPKKDDLKCLEEEPRQPYDTRKNKYKNNTCGVCIEENRVTCNSTLRPGNANREKNKEGKETGRWICNRCISKYYNNMPGSYHNIMKALRDHRIGNIDPNSTAGKGDNFEELTCRWRSMVSTILVENLNKKLDNFTVPLDHSPDSDLGIIQTRGKLCDYHNIYWSFGSLEREWNKKFNYMICYCASKDGTLIDRLYIFPKKEIEGRKTIKITKNHSDFSWYEQYRITDEETIKKVNEIWKQIINKKDI